MSNQSDPHTRAQRTAAEEEQRINAIVDRRIRETFKNGLPSGTYSSYLWDGMKIVGGGAGGGTFVGVHYAMSSQVFSAADNTVIDFDNEIDDDDGLVTTGASWAFTAPSPGHYYAYAAIQIGGGVTWSLARLRLVPSAHTLILLDQVAGMQQTWLRGGALLTLDDLSETVYAQLYVDPGATITEGYISIFQV